MRLDVSRDVDWLARRVHHPDAIRLASLVGNAAAFVADGLSRRICWFPAAVDPSLIADADRLWDDALTRGVRAPGFRLVRDGETLARGDVTRRVGIGNETVADVIQPNRVLEHFDAGASVVLQGLHFSDPATARLANNLALDLDQPVQANAYLSPRASRGLDVHFDYHDVLVVQLAGTKRWRVWDRLDRTQTPVRGGPQLELPSPDELGAPSLDRVLRPGDCVHIPRGCPHSPETVDDESSHLTIGIMSFTRQRLVERGLAALVGDEQTAALLPSGALGGVDGTDEVLKQAGAEVASALDAVAFRTSGASLRRLLAREVWQRQPATRLRPRRRPAIADDAALALTPGPLVWAEQGEGRAGEVGEVTLGLGDRELHMPDEAWPLLTALLGNDEPSRSVGALTRLLTAELDAESVRTVIDRLAVEGLLTGG